MVPAGTALELPRKAAPKARRVEPVTVVLAGAALTLVIRHPLMPVYLDILHKVIAR